MPVKEKQSLVNANKEVKRLEDLISSKEFKELDTYDKIRITYKLVHLKSYISSVLT